MKKTIDDDEIPEVPLILEIQIIQGKNMISKKDPYVMIKVGGDELYRTAAAKKALNPSWQGEPFVGKYEAENDGPIYLEVATGKGSSQAVTGRSLIPLRGEEERKTSNENQPPIWLRVSGSDDSDSAELQVSILAEPIIREANVTLAREKKPVKLILIADTLYVFNDVETCRKLRRRVPLGPNSRMKWDINACEIQIEPPETADSSASAPLIFKLDNKMDAMGWNDALRPFVGPVQTPIFGGSLQDAMNADRVFNPWNSSGIPAFLDLGLKFIEKVGLKEQGIFRIGYTAFVLDDAIRRIETGQSFVEDFDSPHMVTGVLKKYFRSLPECIMTQELLDEVMDLFGNNGQKTPPVESVKQIIAKLPPLNAEIIGRVFRLCALICSHQDENMMTERNMSIVIGPAVFCVDATSDDASLVLLLPKVNAVTVFMIEHANELFPFNDKGQEQQEQEKEEKKEEDQHKDFKESDEIPLSYVEHEVPISYIEQEQPMSFAAQPKQQQQQQMPHFVRSYPHLGIKNNPSRLSLSATRLTSPRQTAANETNQYSGSPLTLSDNQPSPKQKSSVPPRRAANESSIQQQEQQQQQQSWNDPNVATENRKPLPSLPLRSPEVDKSRLFEPVDPDDLESALKRGLAIYDVYGNGGGTKGWVEESRFCDLLVDLKYSVNTEDARSILLSIFPKMPVLRNKFVTWWMDNHGVLIPYN